MAMNCAGLSDMSSTCTVGTRLWVTITSVRTLLAVAKLKCASPKGIPWTHICDNSLQLEKSTVHDTVGKMVSGTMSSCTLRFSSNFTKEHVSFRSCCDEIHNDTLKRRLIASIRMLKTKHGHVNTAAFENSAIGIKVVGDIMKAGCEILLPFSS